VARRAWAERIAALEDRAAELLAEALARPDPAVEAGLTEAELERSAHWLELCRRLEAEPLTAENLEQREDAELAASAGARWLHCRLQHGPGLCHVDCPGEDRHRPVWMPRSLPEPEALELFGEADPPDELAEPAVHWRSGVGAF
jgi:hypothetical protein